MPPGLLARLVRNRTEPAAEPGDRGARSVGGEVTARPSYRRNGNGSGAVDRAFFSAVGKANFKVEPVRLRQRFDGFSDRRPGGRVGKRLADSRFAGFDGFGHPVFRKRGAGQGCEYEARDHSVVE